MRPKETSPVLSRRSALAAWALPLFLYGESKKPPPPLVHIPEEYLEDLRRRTDGEHPQVSREYFAGYFLNDEMRRGRDVSVAISELRGIHPDLAVVQIDALLSAPEYGGLLSRNGRRAIVELTNTWPETFEPYYPGESGMHTRARIVSELRSYPSLRNAFIKYGRPTETLSAEMISERQ